MLAFRSARETIRKILAQIDRWCADFDEVHRGAKDPGLARGPIAYFDGRFRWYRFG